MDIKAGEPQLRRIILNLLNNAIEAIGDRGSLTIKTEPYHLDEYEAEEQQRTSGDYVKLSISDSGRGVPDSLGQKIFEPFVTTKVIDGNHGTGLGLSVAATVVKDHGGFIDYTSKVGEGTTFHVFFPVGSVTNQSLAVQ
jgi:signal transduction histidine kinase